MRVYIVSYTTPDNHTYEHAFHDVCNANKFAETIAHEFNPDLKADESAKWVDTDYCHSHYNTNGYRISFVTLTFDD